MNAFRRISILVTAGLLAIAVMVGAVGGHRAVSADAAGSLAAASAYFDSTVVLARGSTPQGGAGDELAVALGYLERQQLGIGGVFQLVDEANHDPRLGNLMGRRVGMALLDRVRHGQALSVDPVVLDGGGPWGVDGHGATGAAHVALIRHAIESASDPRAGELAVRLGYLIESAKGTLAWSTVAVATQVAALLRDDALSQQDAHDLFADAAADHSDVLDLLATRRLANGFRAEQPALAPLSGELQLEAMRSVPALVRALDTLDRTTAPPVAAEGIDGVPASLIGPAFASRLATLAQRQPPQSQVVVTLRTQAPGGMRASNGEDLAAVYASTRAPNDSSRRANALAVLSAAVAVRSLAQEAPWFAGDTGPVPTDLIAEFGLRSVTFGKGVPADWQPFYLRELQNGLRDMQRVFPAFSVSGLHVHFGIDALQDSALAMHDPRTRTLQLSVITSSGTIAHELSHDLDWQTARRLFANGGGYSTDRAMTQHSGALSSSIRGLAAARVLRPFGGPTPPSDRPAELFARSADWFVASTLAQQGISNGFLTAIEDPMLAGYAAGQPTALGTAGAQSLTSAIEEMTYLPDSLRIGFEAQWSDPLLVDPTLLVRRALEAPVSWRTAWPRDHGVTEPAEMLASIRPTLCLGGDGTPAWRAREDLLLLAVDARARGVVQRRARYRPSSLRAGWANSVLGVAPWSSEQGAQLVDRIRSGLIAELTTALPDQGVVPGPPAIFRSSAASCSPISR